MYEWNVFSLAKGFLFEKKPNNYHPSQREFLRELGVSFYSDRRVNMFRFVYSPTIPAAESIGDDELTIRVHFENDEIRKTDVSLAATMDDTYQHTLGLVDSHVLRYLEELELWQRKGIIFEGVRYEKNIFHDPDKEDSKPFKLFPVERVVEIDIESMYVCASMLNPALKS